MSFGVNVYLTLSFSRGINRYFLKLLYGSATLLNHPAGFIESSVCLLPENFAIPFTTDVPQVSIELAHVLLYFRELSGYILFGVHQN